MYLFPLLAPIAPGAESQGTLSGLLFYITLALIFSFICSICEAVILSTTSSHLEVMVQAGQRAGHIMRRLKENVDRPISAILTLNTIAHTVGAAGAGAEAVGVFGDQNFFIITAILTLLILIFSEIIPKTLGAVYWKPLVAPAAYTIQVLVWIFGPAVSAFELITRWLQPREGKAITVTRSELEAMAEIGSTEGSLEKGEHLILRNLLHLNHVYASDIMTPRTVVLALQQDTTVAEVMKRHRLIAYSRIPIYNENTDDIVAFVLRNDILTAAAEDRDNVTLKELSRPIHSVPESMSVARVLEEFTTRQQHIFLVFDEYGGTAGIITMEDAVESLLGAEITDESDLVADLRELAQQRYQRQQKLLGLIIDESPPAGERPPVEHN